MRCFSLFFAMLTVSFTASSDTLEVPNDYLTIQQAIDAAANGDTVLVSPGTYTENIQFKGKAITVVGSEGAKDTIIDGSQSSSVVLFTSGEGLDSVLQGFTLVNGNGTIVPPPINTNVGGGVLCNNGSSPTLKSNIIEQNNAFYGGGIYCVHSSCPIIMNNIIRDNTADHVGGGMRCDLSSDPLIKGNTFDSNKAESGGGLSVYSSEAEIMNNVFVGNIATVHYGGGIYLYDTSAIIMNNLIVENQSPNRGGGVMCQECDPTFINNTIASNSTWKGGGIEILISSPTVKNCILWNNSASMGSQINVDSGSVTVTYSDIQGGWPGIGNIDALPMFLTGNADFGDYFLSQPPCQVSLSPCIDSGDPNSAMIKGTTRTNGYKDTGIVDMGYHYCLPLLASDVNELPAYTGGSVHFSLNAGDENAYRNYLLLGSISGTSPGTLLPGGYATLPLNWDIFTDIMLTFLNSLALQNFLGILNNEGEGEATLNLGSIPGFAGYTMYFAYCLNNPFDFVSNAVEIEIVP